MKLAAILKMRAVLMMGAILKIGVGTQLQSVHATRELAPDVTAELGQLVLARCCRNVVQLPSKTKEDERD